MIIERFHNGDPVPVYARYCSQGRLAPEGLIYVASWVSEDLSTCYQIMEARQRDLVDQWVEKWDDIVDFEVVPVITSPAANEKALLLGTASK